MPTLEHPTSGTTSTFVEQVRLLSSVFVKDKVPLKAKYYPHVTFLAGTALLLAPLCLVLLLSRSSFDYEVDQQLAAIDTRIDPEFGKKIDAAINDTESDTADVALAANDRKPVEKLAKPSFTSTTSTPQAAPALVVPEPSSSNTRVAMRNRYDGEADSLLNIPERHIQPRRMTDTDAVLDMASLDMSNTEKANSDIFPEPHLEVVPIPSGTSSLGGLTKPLEEFIEPIIVAPSHFGATGHLSMTHGGNGAMAGTAIPAIATVSKFHAGDKESSAEPSNVARMEVTDAADNPVVVASIDGDAKRAESPESSSNRTPRSRAAKAKADDEEKKIQEQIAVSSPAANTNRMLKDGTFGEAPPEVIEDIILQQPLEVRPVERMENVVAVTKAKGWPVALVRSDLPDDEWWVQQMVGIRGNAFAARVNFGNEHSISGSVYHLVFVFLDSPDEVRRFRIAKQFKKLPEGIRHTREFTFVRR